VTRPGDTDETGANLVFLRVILNEWDPYSLIEQGAPEDEFDSEREEICRALVSGEVRSESALAERIVALYTEILGNVFTLEECSGVARKMWPWWEAKQRKW
jgi:hypothetical protein